MLDTDKQRFPHRLVVKTPAGLPAAIAIAAHRGLTTPAEWARRALLNALEVDGVRLDADGRIAATPTPTQAEKDKPA